MERLRQMKSGVRNKAKNGGEGGPELLGSALGLSAIGLTPESNFPLFDLGTTHPPFWVAVETDA
jgi:hypothetical protein